MTLRLLASPLALLLLLPLPAASAVEKPPCPFSECGVVVATVDCLGHATVAAAGEWLVPGDWLLVVEAGDSGGATYRNERRWDGDMAAAFADYAGPGVQWVHARLYHDGSLLAEDGDACVGLA